MRKPSITTARRTAILAATCFAVAGCGGTTVRTVIVTRTAEPTTTNVPASTPEPAHRHRRHARTGSRPSQRACDQNITAKVGTTSCPFAENVFWAYWHAWEAGDHAFTAYSPVTQQIYDLTCASGAVVICAAADGAEVRFPLAAVRSYSAAQADRYASTHDTGPASADPGAPPATGSKSGASSSSGSCDPNYNGACLNPTSPDYDCVGGSGNGPDYTGPVQVVGEDHFRLDADGDGYGCE